MDTTHATIQTKEPVYSKDRPAFILEVNQRMQELGVESLVKAYLQDRYHVSSIDEMLVRRGIYDIVLEVDGLIDQLTDE